MDRVILLVLDGVGAGALPDSAAYGDVGSDTLSHVLAQTGARLTVLWSLGLGQVLGLPGRALPSRPEGAYGRMAQRAVGKDSTIGHWELMGCVAPRPFPTYPGGFPPDVLAHLQASTGRGVIGNRAASGTEIIKDLCAEHLRTGSWIVYTSADSVLQIAAHERVARVDELYGACEAMADYLMPARRILRVIARPFVGEPGALRRTPGRRDINLPPPVPTALDRLTDALVPVVTVGKVDGIFAGRGITEAIHTAGNSATMAAVRDELSLFGTGLLFANLIDFDMLYGHRNDVAGFGAALEAVDAFVGEIRQGLRPRELLLISADHGCDPTMPGTDHTREYVPVLACGPGVRQAVDLGERRSFADLGATVCEALGIDPGPVGAGFWETIARPAIPEGEHIERQRVDWFRRRSALDGGFG